MKLKFITVLGLSLVLLMGACGGKSDADMQSDADKALKANTATSGVSVEVIDGVATIKGEVADDTGKSTAAAVAKVDGIKSVVNEVTVKSAREPAASGSDDEIKAKIEESFKKNGCDGATVEVKDGTATIAGSVSPDKFAECVMAVKEAKPKNIENRLENK